MNFLGSFRRWNVDPKIGVFGAFSTYRTCLDLTTSSSMRTEKVQASYFLFIDFCVMNLLSSRHWALLSLAHGKTKTQKDVKKWPFFGRWSLFEFLSHSHLKAMGSGNLVICLTHHLDQISHILSQPIASIRSCTNSNLKKNEFFKNSKKIENQLSQRMNASCSQQLRAIWGWK